MKHLKTYENKNNYVWVLTNISTTTPELIDVEVFEDEESVKNFFIELVNEVAKDDMRYELDPKYDGGEIIFTLEDAIKYCDEHGYIIEYHRVIKRSKYDLQEELKIGGDAKKYNI